MARVRFARLASEDLRDIRRWTQERAGRATAVGYVRRIVTRCDALTNFPTRGSPRNDLAPGVRTISFERRLLIVYHVLDGEVTILRIIHGAHDVPKVFGEA